MYNYDAFMNLEDISPEFTKNQRNIKTKSYQEREMQKEYYGAQNKNCYNNDIEPLHQNKAEVLRDEFQMVLLLTAVMLAGKV